MSEIDLTEAEVEALRFLRDFNGVEKRTYGAPYSDWDRYLDYGGVFNDLAIRHGLTRWDTIYEDQWALSPTGRALVERLEGER
jgi:hypothetical protein